jgi:dTDP-4-amino-4,6-dideoxygalactose transaminase
MNNITVPYLDLVKSYSLIKPELQRAFLKVLNSGHVILGKEVEQFEETFAKFSSVKYSLGVGNGLDALTISLRVLGVGAKDEVIVPSNTYIATLVAVSRIGAIPVMVEPKIDTYNIDSEKIEKAITRRTKAIIPVHLFGQACEMEQIMQIAKKYKLFVVEDNAQSQGAFYNGKITGSFGDINATSFYPGKNLGAIGDAGAITTDNKKYYETSLCLRNYGENKRYYNSMIGYNSRMDELQAAFLKIRLNNLGEVNKRKNKIASFYLEELKGIGDLIPPVTVSKSTHVYHIFCIRTKKRDALRDYLEAKGITTLIHYPVPPHLQKAYAFLGYKKGGFPIVEQLAKTSLSLPIFPEITPEQLGYTVSRIKTFFKQ